MSRAPQWVLWGAWTVAIAVALVNFGRCFARSRRARREPGLGRSARLYGEAADLAWVASRWRGAATVVAIVNVVLVTW